MSEQEDTLPPDRQDRYTWDFAEVMISQCAYCNRLSPTSEDMVCQAFPVHIPEAINTNQHDHRTVYYDPETGLPADTGVRGDESLLFEPKPTVPREVLERLYKVLDKAAS